MTDTPEPRKRPTDVQPQGAAPPVVPRTAAPAALPRGESQWSLIWREFRKRPLALFCAAVILVVITVSIFAPFLANDRPLWYYGYNRFEYEEAGRTVRAMVGRLAELQKDESDEAQAEIARLLAVADLQIALMTYNLPADKTAALVQFRDRLREVATPETRPEDAAALLAEMRAEIRRDFDARNAQFQSSHRWPVIASLHWLAAGFITFNVLLLTFPLWRRVVKKVIGSQHSSARGWAQFATLFGLPLVAAALWWLFVPARVDRTDYKRGTPIAEAAEQSPVVYEQAVWPPIPYGLDESNLDLKYAGPFSRAKTPQSAFEAPHVLGTDEIGRDVLSRMIWGGRISLSVGVVAVAIYVTLGIIIGAVAGYFRGIWDMLISRIIEVVICFPSFFLILTIVAFLGPSIFNIMIVIGLTGWTGVARLVRGEFLRLAEQEFVLAGRALGYSAPRIIFRHVLPNAMAPVLVAATFGVAGAILTESALSFLGFGITVPTPSWGGILASGRDAIFRAPWLIYWPGGAIFITITAYNLVGEALRDAADPRLRGERAS